jgi:class 3 adenylate cyclase
MRAKERIAGLPEHKLLAIMFTDVVGFSTSMSADERTGIAILQRNRSIIKPAVERFKGTFHKEIGDGTLSSFPSAIESVLCALSIQDSMLSEGAFRVRIGIHVGDVIIDSNDVFGDGVNIASRLEPHARPGLVCVSRQVYDLIRNKSFIAAESLGEKSLKGITGPVELFSIGRRGDDAGYEEFVREVLGEGGPKGSRSRPQRRRRAIALAVAAAFVALLAVWAASGWRRPWQAREGLLPGGTGVSVGSPSVASALPYAPTSSEELYGVWKNERNIEKKAVFSDRGLKWYFGIDDVNPFADAFCQIAGKRTDPNGDVYYWMYGAWLSGPFSNSKFQVTVRISAMDTILEFAFRPVDEYRVEYYPIKLDPRSDMYRLYFRQR